MVSLITLLKEFLLISLYIRCDKLNLNYLDCKGNPFDVYDQISDSSNCSINETWSMLSLFYIDNHRYLNDFINNHYSTQQVNLLCVVHKDENQVRLDVERSFVHLKRRKISNLKFLKLKAMLYDLIVLTLRLKPSLNYFQGFHDIVSIFLLELDLSLFHLQTFIQTFALHWCRDSMSSNFNPIIGHLRLLQKILITQDLELSSIIERTSPDPIFALPWLLTFFSHDIHSQSTLLSLFDIWITQGPLSLLYFSAAFILTKKHEILNHSNDDVEDDEKFANLHSVLYSIPSNFKSILPNLINIMNDIKNLYPLNHPSIEVEGLMNIGSVLRNNPLSIPDSQAEHYIKNIEYIVRQPLPQIKLPATKLLIQNKNRQSKCIHYNKMKWVITLSVTLSAILFGFYSQKKQINLDLLYISRKILRNLTN